MPELCLWPDLAVLINRDGERMSTLFRYLLYSGIYISNWFISGNLRPMFLSHHFLEREG